MFMYNIMYLLSAFVLLSGFPKRGPRRSERRTIIEISILPKINICAWYIRYLTNAK